MGQRANLIIVSEPAEYALYDTHWGADMLHARLLWGPEQALAYIRQQRPSAEGADWLDEVWAEGGAVLDTTRRELLWFGGADVSYEIPLRRVHLGIMRELWPGWSVEWAHEGVAALARYVGEPVEPLLKRPGCFDPVFEEPAEPDWLSHVISLCDGGRFKVHAQDDDPVALSLCGPKVLEALRAANLPDRYDYAARTSEFPSGGIHVDADARRVELWCATPAAELTRLLRAAWPGWKAVWHRDRFEAHQDVLGDRLALPVTDEDELVGRIRASALRAHRELAIEVGHHHPDSRDRGLNELEQGADAEEVFDAATARWRARVAARRSG